MNTDETEEKKAGVLKDITEEEKAEVLEDIKGAMHKYHSMAVFLQNLITGLGIFAIGSFVAATSLAGLLNADWVKCLSFVSILILTLFTTFNISGKHNDMRKAWRHLNYAYLRYKTGKLNLGQLVDAKNEAELILGYIEFNNATIKQNEKEPKEKPPGS